MEQTETVNMKINIFFIFNLVIILTIALTGCNSIAGNDSDRRPVWAGKFYPASQEALGKAIAGYTEKAGKRQTEIPGDKALKALILPHAGYIYSGQTAAHASYALENNKFKKIILLGPDHNVGIRYGAISDVLTYSTPLGKVRLHKDAAYLRENSIYFKANPSSDRLEHSLEVVLPFLQYYQKNFELVPIVFGQGASYNMALEIEKILDPETLVVVSSDLSHYLPYDEAVKKDKQTIKLLLDLKIEELMAGRNTACGISPIIITLILARQNNWQPILLNYTNSGDTAGSRDRVVGYAAIAFYGDTVMENKGSNQLRPETGKALCKLARQTIMEKFKSSSLSESEKNALAGELASKSLDQKQGVFVTLTKNGQLRGCIGSLAGHEAIRDGIKRNALNAAFKDHRFRPVSSEELGKIDIEVSVLSNPAPLEYQDSTDLLNKIRPNIDGVILSKGPFSATFLPQVWSQLPRKEDFLGHLCQKAGLASNAWQTDKLEIKTYQVQYFEEHDE
jgi:MEMO1 family protein